MLLILKEKAEAAQRLGFFRLSYIMTLLDWLHRPYPLLDQRNHKRLLVLGFSIFTYLFLLIYQPFGAEQLGSQGPLFLLGFATMTALGLGINYFLLPFVLPTWFRADAWRIRNELIYLAGSFLLVGTLNYGFNAIVGQQIAPQYSLLSFWAITLSVGVFPTVITVFLIELYLNRSNLQKAAQLNAERQAESNLPKVAALRIVSDTLQAEEIRLRLDDFIFATSDGNYCSIFYWKDEVVQRQLFRLSLKKLEAQLMGFSDLIRCHRSYLINKNHINRVAGNARSLTVTLNGVQDTIPVSRNFPRQALI